MKRRSTKVLAMIVLSLASTPLTCLGHTVSFQGLGDLPGGSFISSAEDVSADGAVVVGWSMGAEQLEAFRWTKSDGIQRLWPPLDEHQWSQAYAVSADGSVVVGATGFDGGMGPSILLDAVKRNNRAPVRWPRLLRLRCLGRWVGARRGVRKGRLPLDRN